MLVYHRREDRGLLTEAQLQKVFSHLTEGPVHTHQHLHYNPTLFIDQAIELEPCSSRYEKKLSK